MARKRGQGEGSISQRKDGLWVAAISTPAGRKYAYARTRKDATLKLQALQQAAAGGLPQARRDITVDALMAEYLESKKAAWSPRSYNIAAGISRRHITPHLGTVRLADLDMRRVALWLRALGQTRTAQLARGHLRAACALACRYDWIARNPVVLTDAPKVTPKRPRELSIGDVRAILLAAKSPPEKSAQIAKSTDTDYYPLVALLLGCGLRIGEALALRWEDWEPASRTVSVKHTLGRVGGESSKGVFELRSPKTRAGVRDLIAPGFVAEALGGMEKTPNDLGLIFCASTGNPLDSGNVRRGIALMLARSGIKSIGLHHMRHAHASLLLDDGVPLTIVSSVLGHANTQVTATIYAHKLKGSHGRVAVVMDEIFGAENEP